jgi:hypothetical protein
VIIADHILIMNATDAQVTNMARLAPPPSATMESQNGVGPHVTTETQMIQKLSQQSGMNLEYSKLFVLHLSFFSLLIRSVFFLLLF